MTVTVNEIVQASEGRLLAGDGSRTVTGISLDSRKVGEGDLFVPIVGERVDAHRFLEQVAAMGAAAVFTSEHEAEDIPAEKAGEAAWIRVDDTRAALQRFGSWCRGRLSIPVVGITGSVGKTTTREMIAAALGADGCRRLKRWFSGVQDAGQQQQPGGGSHYHVPDRPGG